MAASGPEKPRRRAAAGGHVRSAALSGARRVLGPAVRRLKRELQWRALGVTFATSHQGPQGSRHVIAAHSTSVFRPLSGVDMELQRNKVINLRIAARALDGIVLMPGERFSFWRVVGRPSMRRGFVDGVVLCQGKVTTGVGGGLCQMTNLLYWMTLHTPLTVVERWRHSYDVFPDVNRTLPFGSGATCAWPSLDLQIENRTKTAYGLSLKVTGTELIGAWNATEPFLGRFEIEERSHRITHDGPGVYVRRNEIWRLEYALDGTLIAEELAAVNDALMMYQPCLAASPAEPGGTSC